MEFLHSFLRRHLAGKPVVTSPNVGCLTFSCFSQAMDLNNLHGILLNSIDIVKGLNPGVISKVG